MNQSLATTHHLHPSRAASGALASRPADAKPTWLMRLHRLLMRPVHSAAWRFRLLEYGGAFMEHELRSMEKVPLRARPWLLWRGFMRGAWVLYDLEHNDPDLYVTDYERHVRTRLINGPHAIVLDDKLLFYRLFEGPYARYVPTVFGTVSGNRVVPGNIEDEELDLAALLKREGRLAVKPSRGGGGVGFSSLEIGDDGFIRDNGTVIEADGLEKFSRQHDGHLVSEFVTQHPVVAGIYPRTTNTMRLLLMQDEQQSPFIAAATLRLGSSTTGPTDRVSSGGYCAPIDIESGRLGKAMRVDGDHLSWHAHHPDTGAPIEGVEIPNWQEVQSGLRGIMGRNRFLRYVGWDIVVTEDGFRILEGNNFSGLRNLQVHKPLLADPRVAAFYRRNGVLKGRRRNLALED